MNTPNPAFRLFLSSPGDVHLEREVAARTIRRLTAEFADRCRLECTFWDHEPVLEAPDSSTAIPVPSMFDVVICILWSRLGKGAHGRRIRPDGTPYGSETEFEFEDAAMAAMKRGTPELLVYFGQREVVFPAEPREERERRASQYDELQAFFQKWFYDAGEGALKAAFNTFGDLAHFEELLEAHLRRIIGTRFPRDSQTSGARSPTWTQGSPFRGLAWFEFEHAPVFFGRTRAIDEILGAVRRQIDDGRAFTLIFGGSGSGKSSLLRAGILPMLTRPGVIEGIGLWRRALMRPSEAGGDLFAGLANALVRRDALPELLAVGTSVATLVEMLRENPAGVAMLVKGGLSQAARDLQRAKGLSGQPRARLALGVDQMEEAFTLATVTAEDRRRFARALEALARSGFVVVLATLRSEYFPRCAEMPELMLLKEGAGQYQLGFPGPAEIGQMIRLPASAAGLAFEERPTGERLDDGLREVAIRQPGMLPLLQFLLEELFGRRSGRILTFAAYEELGGVEGALRCRAESVCAALPPSVRETLPSVFRQLAVVDEGGQGGFRRRRAFMEDVAAGPAGPLVEALIAARLLATDLDDKDGRPVVSVAHEALFEHWPAVRESLEHNSRRLLTVAQIERGAERWVEGGRADSLVMAAGAVLSEAVDLLQVGNLPLRAGVREFILASHLDSREVFLARGRMAWLALAGVIVVTSPVMVKSGDSFIVLPIILGFLAFLSIFLIDQDSGSFVRRMDRALGPRFVFMWILLLSLAMLVEGNGLIAFLAVFLLPFFCFSHGCFTRWLHGALPRPLSWPVRKVLKRVLAISEDRLGELLEISCRREKGWQEDDSVATTRRASPRRILDVVFFLVFGGLWLSFLVVVVCVLPRELSTMARERFSIGKVPKPQTTGGESTYRDLMVQGRLRDALHLALYCAEDGETWALREKGLLTERGWAASHGLGDWVGSSAAPCYLSVLQSGDARARIELAGCYAEGRGVPRDMTKAREMLREVAAEDEAMAQLDLASNLGSGTQTAEQIEAAAWAMLVGTNPSATDGQRREAGRLLGVASSRLTPEDRGKAEKQARTRRSHLALQRARDGDERYFAEYGRMLEEGIDIPVDRRAAGKIHLKGQSAESVSAALRMLRSGEIDATASSTIRSGLLTLSLFGEPWALGELASFMVEHPAADPLRRERDLIEVRACLLEARRQGIATLTALPASFSIGLPADLEPVVELFREEMSENIRILRGEAALEKGRKAFNLVDPRSMRLAVEHLSLAESLDNDVARTLLGDALWYGVGVASDSARALELWRIAARHGESGARRRLVERLLVSTSPADRVEGATWARIGAMVASGIPAEILAAEKQALASIPSLMEEASEALERRIPFFTFTFSKDLREKYPVADEKTVRDACGNWLYFRCQRAFLCGDAARAARIARKIYWLSSFRTREELECAILAAMLLRRAGPSDRARAIAAHLQRRIEAWWQAKKEHDPPDLLMYQELERLAGVMK